MASRLELGRAKMIVSPPSLNLRKAASYHHDKGPLSATSSRFNFNHLLFSPPPSPSLPALIPRPKKSPIRPRPSRVFRIAVWSAGAILIFYLATLIFRRHGEFSVARFAPRSEFEMVGQDDLPDFPTPIVVSDNRGRSRWTVSVPPSYDFPLSITEYTEMGSKCREVASRARDLHRSSPVDQMVLGYGAADSYFIDVREAEQVGLLPGVTGRRWQTSERLNDGHLVGENKDSLVEKPVCERSMTFVLETADAGLGGALMMLWTSYGLAKRQRRSFFIDDTRWAYGKYTDMFQAPPSPDCRPPPRHEMLPCPLLARHLVVSAATMKETLGGSLNDIASTPLDVSSVLFDLARQGYGALFHPIQEDAKYIDNRVKALASRVASAQGPDRPIIGMHIRHGDRKPFEFQYRDSYIPHAIFAERAKTIVDERHNTSAAKPLVILASDDPTVYESDEFSDALRAQEHIRLASKAAIHRVNPPDRHVMHHFVDETFGWEGGFFAAMFWNLGLSSMSSANAAATSVGGTKTALAPSAETLRLRSLLGRAYVLDLAVLAKASDEVICTVSAMGCRLLGIMMGWEAVQAGSWANVDGDFGWTGLTF